MCQVDLTFPVDPCITEEMYNVAVSLIQSFDEMEAKDQRSGITMRHAYTTIKIFWLRFFKCFWKKPFQDCMYHQNTVKQ